ncbi:MAG TPA: hypothetical protein VHC22_21270 [Pirellulales bacterium]|nr:hypothetical protein [Pirellulales bacterium]
MTRRIILLCFSFLLAEGIVAALFAGGTLQAEISLSGPSAQVSRSSPPPYRTRDWHWDRETSAPFIAAVESDDTEEWSGREKIHVMSWGQPPAAPSRRAIRLASSVRQQRPNTLSALCVRLQI